MQTLLDLLRGNPLPHTIYDSEFADVLDLADQENLLPWATECLLRSDCDFAAGQRERLDQIQRKAQLASFVWTETLKTVLTAFQREGIAVIALKGPCLAERIYGDAALRNCFDLDLLVRSADHAHAEEVMTHLGFHPNGPADDYHRPWSRNTLNLELHHNVENPLAFEFDVDAAWSRAYLWQFQGAPVWIFSPQDELLYLCLHAVRHRFERLAILLDLALGFRRLPLHPEADSARAGSVLENVLALGAIMAAHLDPKLQMPQQLRVTPRDRRRLERLGHRLWQELMLEPPRTLDWATQHAFYLEIETPGWNRFVRRVRHQRILVTRLIDADFAFAGRFNLHRNWQVRMLRPVRLLIKTLRPSPRLP